LLPPDNTKACLAFRDASLELLEGTGIDFTRPEALGQLAVQFADGFVQAESHTSLTDYAKQLGKPCLVSNGDGISSDEYAAFYQQLVGNDEA
ncbi:MAG: glycogen synthase, partial [Bacteroidaceae bacterium]|nr:glycogen synthase [Bacteroidaceae bacterium]